jgi:hypothetical protein
LRPGCLGRRCEARITPAASSVIASNSEAIQPIRKGRLDLFVTNAHRNRSIGISLIGEIGYHDC